MKIYKYKEINSTNDQVKKIENKDDFIVTAEIQTNGRGTNNRTFLSLAGGLYMSLKTSVLFENITIRAASAAFLALQSEQVKIKWINDLYYEQKKLGGILVEKVDDYYIVGIGINFEQTSSEYSFVEQFSSLTKDEFIADFIKIFYSNFDYLKIYKEQCSTLQKVVRYKGNIHQIKELNQFGNLVLDDGSIIISTKDIEILY